MLAHVDDKYILSELCDGSLVDFMQKFPNCKLSEPLIVNIMRQICLGLSQLHEKKICHRDLKVENILFKGERIIIADFGSCTRKSDIDFKIASKTEIKDFLENVEKSSTHMYRAPELIDQYSSEKADLSSDIWALGCLLYLLATCKHPF